jgi:hypothetical protein
VAWVEPELEELSSRITSILKVSFSSDDESEN